MEKTSVNRSQQPIFQKADEKILAIKRSTLFPEGIIQGFVQADLDYYQNIISSNKEFVWRSLAETDINYKQIIPYLIFRYQSKYFLMQRGSKAGDSRLASKYTFGIGGHIREEDLNAGASLIDWAGREFEEEVNYSGNKNIKFLGLINDETNFVGQVHTGFVFLIEGDSSDISIKSELTMGMLLEVDECTKFYHLLESWSALVFDCLTNKNSEMPI